MQTTFTKKIGLIDQAFVDLGERMFTDALASLGWLEQVAITTYCSLPNFENLKDLESEIEAHQDMSNLFSWSEAIFVRNERIARELGTVWSQAP